MIVGVVGTLAAGKSAVAHILEGEGFTRISLSDLLREEAARRNLRDSRDVLYSIANEMREKYGPAALMQETLNRMQDGDHVVDSIRNLAEIEVLRSRGGVLIIGVDAEYDLRYRRAMERQAATGRDESASTEEEFRLRDEREDSEDAHRPQRRLVLQAADVVILNNGTQNELRDAVLRAVASFKSDDLASKRSP